jgi:hypothetical protein
VSLFGRLLREITEGEFDRRPGFIPDGFELNDNVLTIFEVEDTSKLTMTKLQNIQLVGHELLDCNKIATRLVCTDRYRVIEKQIWSVFDDLLKGERDGRESNPQPVA